MAFTTGNDINILQGSDLTNVSAGAGNDRYVLTAATLNPNQKITITDTQGTNTLQLVGGLAITSAKVSNDALLLKLNNGAEITVLGAASFQFQTGGDSLAGTGGSIQSYADFVKLSLGVAAGVPAAGANPVDVGALTVNPNGGATAGNTGGVTPTGFALTASADNYTGTTGNDAVSGTISATATSTTFNSTDNILDVSTTDTDTFTLTTEVDVTAANSGLVRNFETVNVNFDATTATGVAPATTLDFAATNFSNVKTFNFDVIRATSAVNALDVTAQGSNNAKVVASDDFNSVVVAGTASNNMTVEAKAAGSAGAATTVTVTGALADVTVVGAGFLNATSNASTGLLTATAAKNLTLSGTAAQIINATSTAGNVTISDATASVNTTVNAAGDVSISNLDAAGKLNVTAGGTIALSGTGTGAAGIDATSAVLSGVGASTIGAANALTSLTISGNGGAASYDMSAGSDALTDVIVNGDQNVTLKVDASSIEVGTSALNVVDSGAGTFTLELETNAGDVNLVDSTNLVDKLLVNVDNTSKTLTVKSGQVVTYKADQSGGTLAVGTAASAATNNVTLKLDDEVRDGSAVDIAGLTITQAKTVTIDASVDTTAAGTAMASSIGGITANNANSNITINTGVNGMTLTGANNLGTGKLTVTGSGAVALGTATLTASELDASAVTGVVSGTALNPTNVRTISTGSANDTLALANTAAADVTVKMGAGNDALTLAGQTSANKVTVIDLGDGTDTLKFVANAALVKGTGSVSLAGVETIEFASGAGQQIQAELLTGKTYNINSAVTANTSSVAVVVATTDTVVNLSTLAGSTAVDTTVAGMTFATDASANTTTTNITGMVNAKNSITGSAAADSLTGGTKDDSFNYSADTLLFTTGTSGVVIDTIVGGTGTDAINFTATATPVTVLNTSSWANVSGVEKITTVTTSGVGNTSPISLSLDVTAQTQGITTVDLSGDTNATGVNVVDASEYTATSGITITGSAGIDNLTGGAGNDTFVYKLTTDLFGTQQVIDSIVGGAGTDTISVGTTGTAFTIANDDVWTRASGVETIKAVANTAANNSIALDVTAYAAGIRTVDLSLVTGATGNVIDASEIIGVDGLTLIGSATGVTSITGGSANDTITGGSANDTIAGGAGNDSISLTAGGNDTVTIAATNNGSDTITGFTAGANGVVAGYDILAGTLDGITNLVDAAAIVAANTPDDITVADGKITELNYAFTGTSLASSSDGTGLLLALKGINNNADVALTTTGAATGFLVAYQGSNAYLYKFDSAATGANTDIGAADITLVATLTNIGYGALVADNFAA